MNRGRLKMLGVLAVMMGTPIALGDPVAGPMVSLFFFYLPWAVIVKLIVPRSRYIGGIAIILLSFFPFVFFVLGAKHGDMPWLGIHWALLFAHGSVLAIVDAAKLRTW